MMGLLSHIGVLMAVICLMAEVLITKQESHRIKQLPDEDTQPPRVMCPHDVTGSTDHGKATKRLEWRQPLATDNVDRLPTVVSFPDYIVSPYDFPIGSTRIIYTATDNHGNSQSCVFTVTIKDEEAPSITCPKNIKVIMQTAGPVTPVYWPKPRYEDNSGQPVTLFTESVQGSGFRVGRHQIKYEVTDRSGNKASCTFTIVVSGARCTPYDPPQNGLLACIQSAYLGGDVCTPQCYVENDFSRIPANLYICRSSGDWYAWDSRPTVSPTLPWPNCTDEFKPGSQQKGEIWQSFAGSCADPSVQRQAKGNLLQGIQTVFGPNISLLETSVKIICGKTEKKIREVNSSDSRVQETRNGLPNL